MEENASDPQQLRQAGLSALQSGDALTARRQFERIVARGEADSVVWVALAMACGRLGDAPQPVEDISFVKESPSWP